ncbi:hypothetical protein MMAG44476_14200 [Mycolicibacterium mageritense DSM 44476 = CIP 104973]|uniref:Uncharacterized protein n=1 Tax=Mycolicibacterium mageritense TaxID=53462 RepID=A0ABN5Y646_MYCME|nr:hypothetical protein [Mycolicibacterium mageritense]BBX33607.1 hypothetical protein MMAGJ_28890 [Mycolicibacterium mageritense]CDO22036.1 hypothetical protein BN978_02501 [Mycolicibacterium mageritense DSM 44476 = CIP 104973]
MNTIHTNQGFLDITDLSTWCAEGEGWERIEGMQGALEDDLKGFLIERDDEDFAGGFQDWLTSGAPERVRAAFLADDVDSYIEESTDIESLANYAGEHADDFDLDAIVSDWSDWLGTRRDAIAAALPDENGSVFEAIGGGPVLDGLFQKHDKNG